jgi:hypothetical protein
MEADEGKRFLALAGCSDPSELDWYWEDILRTADANRDGRISKEEFLVYILGDEELTSSGDFVDEERAASLSAAVRTLRAGPPDPAAAATPAAGTKLALQPEQKPDVGSGEQPFADVPAATPTPRELLTVRAHGDSIVLCDDESLPTAHVDTVVDEPEVEVEPEVKLEVEVELEPELEPEVESKEKVELELESETEVEPELELEEQLLLLRRLEELQQELASY